MALSFLDRERSVASPGFSRWLVPPAALAIHLSIGQAYAFSVFKNPLLALHGADGAAWNLKEVGYIFSIAIAFLGISAALFGAWLEKTGPRRAMFYAAICFGCGFYVAALGADLHSLALIYLGYGVIGGIGLGLGYISPVSTLIKWFPDRPGLATGLAIMGFEVGTMIGGLLATNPATYFVAHGQAMIPMTFITMGVLYFIFMMFGVFTIRVPAPDWKPAGWTGNKQSALISTHNVNVATAWKTPQFFLLWIVLCTNVTAGIGILEQASPMIQDLFKGTIGSAPRCRVHWPAEPLQHGWPLLPGPRSPELYRPQGHLLLLLPPSARCSTSFCRHRIRSGRFVGVACLLLSMYGGGFATIPAYLKDLFGGWATSAPYPRPPADRVVHRRHRRPTHRQRHLGSLRRNRPRPKTQAYPIIPCTSCRPFCWSASSRTLWSARSRKSIG